MTLHHLALVTLAAAVVLPAQATTTVGSALLIDTATVHAGTVVIGPVLGYASGGIGWVGTADGTSNTAVFDPSAVGTALSAADHAWAKFDPALIFVSPVATNAVIAIPAIGAGWTPDNTGEFWKPFALRVYGCTATAGCIEEGRITEVWTRGVDDTGAMKNADDWTTRWEFSSAYSAFAVLSGDRLVGGWFSPGEGTIDALALPAVPEPRVYSLLAVGLTALALARRRRARD